MTVRPRIIVGVTGASGVEMAHSVLLALRAQNAEIHLILSEAALRVLREESELRPEDLRALADHVYRNDDLAAPVASGSFMTEGMIVVPCSMKTLSGIANAYDEDLIVRAADVCLKERRKVVLVPRETPLSPAHLRNMLTACSDGCVILPPVLSFYSHGRTVEAQLEHLTGKILMQFGMVHGGFIPWKGA